MAESADREHELPLQIERLSWLGFIGSMLAGAFVAFMLALLWGLEAIRNGFFALLDRWNIKARRRPASAFPPGRPRKHTVVQAR